MKKNKLKDLSALGGMVYSTNDDYEFNDEVDAFETLDNEDQRLYVSLDKKQRKGKVVTLVEGFKGPEDELIKLAKYLKGKCGSGGSAKGGIILVQGKFKDKIYDLLTAEGYHVKKKG
jgi:translation initiation factor 1